jgi:hypothetical protein
LSERERERERGRCPIPRALLHSPFNVTGIRAPFQVPQRGPYGKRFPFTEPFYMYSRVSSNKLPPPGSPHRALSKREREREREREMLHP